MYIYKIKYINMDYEKLIEERVLKGDYRKVYSLEEVWLLLLQQ